MLLSEIKGEQAIDMFAEILGPACEIMADPEIQKISQGGDQGYMIKLVETMIREHKQAVIQMLAALNQQSTEDFLAEVTVIKLPMMILDMINDPAIRDLFTSRSPMTDGAASGSAMGSTGANEN